MARDLRRSLSRLRRVAQVATSSVRICYLRAAFRGLSVGFDSYVGPGCEISVGPGGRLTLRRVSVGRGCHIIAGPGARMDIAAQSIGPHSMIVARDAITIGAGSLVAEMVVIRDSDHDRPDGAALTSNHHRSAPITIGAQVWLAAHSTILRGVTIGPGATVGAGAVVTRDVAAGQTVVGVPARPITERMARLP